MLYDKFSYTMVVGASVALQLAVAMVDMGAISIVIVASLFGFSYFLAFMIESLPYMQETEMIKYGTK